MVPKFSQFSPILFICLLSVSEIRAEIIWGPTIEKSGGEYIFETGNKFPNLSGIRGGSRISFPRTFTLFGIQGIYIKDNWEISGNLKTTGWNQKSGEARDEDFLLGTVSTEKTTNIATREWSYRDSATVYSGSRNFADGKGKSTVVENRVEFYGRYYFQNANPDHWREGSGFFLSTGVRYSYFKYLFYDVNQYIETTPIFYGPIGLGLSFSNDLWEFFYGGGYRYSKNNFYFDFSFMPSIGRIKTRDFHVQRSINFFSENYGLGWASKIELGYKFYPNWLSYLRINHRRFFSEGRFTSQGGLTVSDLTSNLVSGFKSHINIKDFSIEFGVLNKVDWNEGKSQSEVKESPEKEKIDTNESN
ncbi:putative porin [Leptospira biflexa]|uniref:putative porin n=1 Tax=Leptospira biflexa TaxID=172 RepID=UPI00108382F4|nr:putative porin [Leptospira biflexa]TGM32044.1 putative porin [Leptospira biflexa]TGM42792.1 putative porin [Leptospira biflexa]TGM45871.1 putative porin [Leptospira biflexa]